MGEDRDRGKRFDHIWVILRRDGWGEGDPSSGVDEYSRQHILHGISGTKAYWDREEAEAETARLNELNEHKGSVYFYVLARLRRRPESVVEKPNEEPAPGGCTRDDAPPLRD